MKLSYYWSWRVPFTEWDRPGSDSNLGDKHRGMAVMVLSSEKRRSPRKNLLKVLQVAWHSKNGTFVSNFSHLSLGGTFIVTRNPPMIGTPLKLLFDVPGGELRVRAVVRRSVPGKGMGVEFVEMQIGDRALLRKLVGATDPSKSRDKLETFDRKNKLPEPPHDRVRRSRIPDHRAHHRFKFTGSVEIINPESGKYTKVQPVNLGRGGCYLKTGSPYPTGTILGVLITKGTESFQALARVAFSMYGQSMGLVFTAIEPAQLQTLETWIETSKESLWLKSNRRIDQQVKLPIPVQVAGTNSRGTPFVEDTKTIIISPYGALVSLKTTSFKGQRLVLSNPRTKAEMECTVVSIDQAQDDQRKVEVLFTVPDKTFWKVAFPPSNWSMHHPDAKRN
ncbi:MAG: PilZ domain-containing protein [Acidobacteriia bacterium]|nr:PilZ domain-containing protein [Terriglobia bacterium]